MLTTTFLCLLTLFLILISGLESYASDRRNDPKMAFSHNASAYIVKHEIVKNKTLHQVN